MRFSARLFTLIFSILFAVCFLVTPVSAQTISSASSSAQSTYDQFRTPNVDANVPLNDHMYTQAVMIDVVSAMMCQLTGIDPTNPQQSCLGVNPQSGKIGMVPNQSQLSQTTESSPQTGGALGVMTNFVSELYTPTVSSSQYIDYLATNFGIIKPALAQTPPATTTAQQAQTDCSNSQFGYGFCGLTPVFALWKTVRDFSYTLLTLVFVVLGIGVMVRFKVDPRTVMTLQNQIPRVVIAIVLITFSYAIAGVMVDLMWTVTYAGITLISNASPKSQIYTCTPGFGQKATGALQNAVGNQTTATPVATADGHQNIASVQQYLINQPVSFVDSLFLSDCKGGSLNIFGAAQVNGVGIHSGILNVSELVSKAFGDLMTNILTQLLGIQQPTCGVFHLLNCAEDGVLNIVFWLAEQIVKLIIIVALFVALFRLWFELLKAYITFLIFVIMGPLWIVFGLIPGRPLGFEKWLRIIFANLAAFPLVAFILAFGRIMMDVIPPTSAGPQSVFIPPLVGNPNLQNFGVFIGFGAIMMAHTIPGMIKERMKAKGSGDYGKTISAGIGYGAGVATSPGRGMWDRLNHKDQYGKPVGSLAVMKQRMWEKTPLVGRRSIDKRRALQMAEHDDGGSLVNYGKNIRQLRAQRQLDQAQNPNQNRMNRALNTLRPNRQQNKINKAQERLQTPSRTRRIINRLNPNAPTRQAPTTPPPAQTPPATPPPGSGSTDTGGTNNGANGGGESAEGNNS